MAVGFKSGSSSDASRTNWDGSGPRPLAWSLWYPANPEAKEAPPAEPSWFAATPVARDAATYPSPTPLPLVLLSHGSGASGMALEWLSHRLAQKGFVALAIDHHGHSGSEPYRAEGFLCLWERARDFSALLDDEGWRAALAQPVAQRASVVGFSAGAYTAMMLVGARVAYSQFEPDNPVKSPVRGPREFPNLADELPELLNNPVFRRSWDRRRDDYADARIAAATAIAPGRSVLGLNLESLTAISRPVQIIGGSADTVAPPAECCQYLHRNIPSSTLEMLEGAGHYTFLPEGSEAGKKAAPELFDDGPSLRRQAVHELAALSIADFAQSMPNVIDEDQTLAVVPVGS
jgi:predicted dienelactone hydrolase